MDNNFNQPDIFSSHLFTEKSRPKNQFTISSPDKPFSMLMVGEKCDQMNKVYHHLKDEKEETDKKMIWKKDEKLKQTKQHKLKHVSKTCSFETGERSFFLEKSLLKKKPINKLKKNSNLPKFICRYFIENFKKYSSILNEDKQMMNEAKRFIKEKKGFLNKDKNSFYSMKHLEQMFEIKNDSSERSKKISHLFRQILHDLLGKQIFPIIANPRLKSSLNSYIVSLKVYRLRVRNKFLMRRMQYK